MSASATLLPPLPSGLYLGADNTLRTRAEHVKYLRRCAALWRTSTFRPCAGMTNDDWADTIEARADAIEREGAPR